MYACLTDSELFGERESGDGEEQPGGQSEVDDDEDRKNPAFVPKKGTAACAILQSCSSYVYTPVTILMLSGTAIKVKIFDGSNLCGVYLQVPFMSTIREVTKLMKRRKKPQKSNIPMWSQFRKTITWQHNYHYPTAQFVLISMSLHV